jgi:hypothetical protein
LGNNVEKLALKVSSKEELERASDFFTSKGYKWFGARFGISYVDDGEIHYAVIYENEIFLVYDRDWIIRAGYKIKNINSAVQLEFEFQESE